MLYKSKLRTFFLVLSTLFALSALGLIIAHWVTQSDLLLTLSTFSAVLFFLFNGISTYIGSKYCERRDQSFIRKLSYALFGCGVFTLIIGIIQLVSYLK